MVDNHTKYGYTVPLKSDDFEWDDAKAEANLAKHGISFEDARRVFDDDDWCELATDTHAYETRYNNLGIVDGRLIHVTSSEGDDGRDRIISARKATKNEQKIHENQKRY